ncbi:UDP-N-acetylmuramoyl-L-alanyl-D-glutamate--2,6-diaminopimelate ligase [Thiomicrorhabdus immobilis]|uniref:UDP-N-acetylmuramoyl-L-alanyl-D-glutamate--2,6-diaminopimelate ligase n=1 Tax=Thiomicrorhabdus immobilis TaxID=2791037 RepID=A0ABM7MEM8_9GAMM|nr:UDP-N-acetylmuramoyl-L-alanyl-D-glutamate--2,6-diaminopimelate ligase [Thiomicrorhabdus immobilis]BCN93873.1 UDP-N-acetylmuramoyl-L-alanyl-D-glutamate--2,6-diaminopimelate ligase [Thiomicrorhabdus immobilis]
MMAWQDSGKHHSKTLVEIEIFIRTQIQDTAAVTFDTVLLRGASFESPRYNDVNVHDLSLDSRKIAEKDVFIALQGEQQHGLNFLESVLKKRPGLVISDRALTSSELALCAENASGASKTPVWVVSNIKDFLGEFAAWFYDQPSRKLKVVGITGTNGKTSSAFFTAQLLQNLGQKVALMGTLGNGPIDDLQKSANTTPDSVSVHRLLHEFACKGMQWVVMEVSSHALCLGRIQGVEFQTVALTQVTRDHMDFHGTLEAYSEAKAKLFTEYPSKNQVLNLADSLGLEICKKAVAKPKSQEIWCYQADTNQKYLASESLANLKVQSMRLNAQGIVFTAEIANQSTHTMLATEQVNLALMGVFNLENVFCALSILLVNGVDWSQLKMHLAKIESVSGRMQVLANSPTIILDFAHTPDALEQVLKAVKAHLADGQGRLKVVFGCGGNRDQGKRPLMGAIAEQYADSVMLTSDNPRDEEPQSIIDDIVKGLSQPEAIQIELDRKQAIATVLQQSVQHDIVVIAGKGHEDYQEVKGVRTPFSDASVVEQWLTLAKNR